MGMARTKTKKTEIGGGAINMDQRVVSEKSLWVKCRIGV